MSQGEYFSFTRQLNPYQIYNSFVAFPNKGMFYYGEIGIAI